VRVEFSPRADADLTDIADYIAAGNPGAAETFVNRLVDRALAIGKAPNAGRVVPELGDPKVRQVLLQRYRIIYRVEASRVLVVTILEGHRRLRR
jgi:toxin ParE1/3/4